MEKQPTLFEALIPLLVLIGLIVINVNYTFGDSALEGANQMALLFGAVAAVLVGWNLGFKWESMLKGIVKSVSSALPSLFILLLIGSLAGAWLTSGVTPAMIYYGLDLLNPKIFLFATCLICIIVSLATGSSWTTVATVGVALIGIGSALGVSEALTAGAIISGAYFGDKMSPLSDTTNLAPAMAGTNLFTHIRYMTYTTIPSIIITLLIFLFIGLGYDSQVDLKLIEEVQKAISSKFNITPFLFLVPIGVIVLILLKVKPIPAIFIGTVLGILFALSFQNDLMLNDLNKIYDQEIFIDANGEEWQRDVFVGNRGENNFQKYFMASIDALTTDVSISVNNDIASDLLSSGGMSGMLNTIWLIVCAMIFGGIMETIGLLQRLTKALMIFANKTWSLVSTTSLSCIVMNFTASDQYISIVVPGRMFADAYKKRGLAPENLSRTLEDSGTVTSVLCPWNTCNAYHAKMLGFVENPWAFVPFCFFNIISPVMTILFAMFMIKIKKLK